MLIAHCSLLIAHCSLLIAHCSLLIAHCSLLIAHCSLLIAHCSLLIAHCSLLIAHCSLLIAHCSLLIAHCSLLRYSLSFSVEHGPSVVSARNGDFFSFLVNARATHVTMHNAGINQAFYSLYPSLPYAITARELRYTAWWAITLLL
ncbi:hypothetical protein APHWI1_1320 [Anaplasma phagocytophilum str. ApWI1]|uniref:Uncharacterized protein n=1 Tax=Anaplasma phagocytophilum str. ApWI1 TaxID=1359155 RepID=A0A0F3PWB8_ANAPH|nr:hypothetical protein APHWI1_1320 [Anaplasma phagocytophilum str. ApWI1]